ncbi:LOW QUALITY PROTEIN: hypothetical protein ACHAXA_007325 [Cyclostephanos tholiformis]|uniref:Uncharacterized protein n=1 Tax=Cyclostephanos tholiformis TaxID=382380 RepID=A0ABD3R8Y0_9STRA
MNDRIKEHEMLVIDDDDNGSGPAVAMTEASSSPGAGTTSCIIGSIRSDMGVKHVWRDIKQLEKMQRRVPPMLDLHYISSQIIAMGPPRASGIRRAQSDERPDIKWTQKRRKQKINDLNELVMFLERRHQRRYLLFNVSDENDDGIVRLLDRQVVHLPWGSPSPSKIMQTKSGTKVRRPPVASHTSSVNSAGCGACNKSSSTPSVSRVMDICYALHAYLSIPPRESPQIFLDRSSSNYSCKPQQMCGRRHHHRYHHHPIQTVACIYCDNGKTRTGVTIACYLRFCNSVPCSLSGFEIFCERRGIMSSSSSSQTQADKDILSHIPPSLRQFFRNFDEVVNMRQFPHPEPLLLRSIELQGVPVDDMPCVDIWEHGDVLRRRIYSSHKNDGDTDGGRNDSTLQLNKWDKEEGSYTVGELLSQDFTLVCRFGGEFANDGDDPSKVLFRYVNNPNFLSGGELELNIAEVDMMRRYADSFDDEDFLLTLVFERVNVSIYDDTDYHDNFTSLCPEPGSWKGLSSTGSAKFDGVIQHDERDVILQGWRVLSDAHLSQISFSEGEYERFCTDLDSSVFKLMCPGQHEIDLRSIALQFTNGDIDSAKAELIDGLFKYLFSSTTIESMKQLALDVTSPIDVTSNGVVGTAENGQNSFANNVVVAKTELSLHVENQSNSGEILYVIENPESVETCVQDRETWPSNFVGFTQSSLVVQSSLKPMELNEKFKECSGAKCDFRGLTHDEREENQAGKYVDDTNPKLSQRVDTPDGPARAENKADYACMWRKVQTDLWVDDAEHKSITEIDHKIHDRSMSFEFLMFEQSTMGEEIETTATVKNICHPNVQFKNDKSFTDSIDITVASSGHFDDQDFLPTKSAHADESQSSFLKANMTSISTVGSCDDNRFFYLMKNKVIETYSEGSMEDTANPFSNSDTSKKTTRKKNPVKCVPELLGHHNHLEITEEVDRINFISDNRMPITGLDQSLSKGNDYDSVETNDASSELNEVRNLHGRATEPQAISRNRITSWQGYSTATEKSAFSISINSDMVVKCVYDCGQVGSVDDNAQADTRDHRGHIMKDFHDSIVATKAVDESRVSNFVMITAGTATYGPSMVDKPNQDGEMDKSNTLNHDPLFEKYYQMLKMGLPLGVVKNVMQIDELDLTIMEIDPDKSAECQWLVLDVDIAASEQFFRGQLTPEVAAGTHSAAYNWIENVACAASLWSSRLGYLSDWQSLPHKVNILPMIFSLRSLEESTNEMNCTRELFMNICPVYEKYYRMLKMGLLVCMAENQMNELYSTILCLVSEKHLQTQRQKEKQDPKYVSIAPGGISREKALSPKEVNRQSNPSSTRDTRGKAAHKNVEKVEPDPRAALIAMLSNRAPLVGSTFVASIESIDQEDSYEPDPRTAVESMLKTQAPAVSPVGASKTDSSEQEVDLRNEHDPTAKQSNLSSTRNTRGKAAHKNVEKVEPNPRVALIAMLNNRATLVGSTTVASIESIDQEDSYEPDPRTAVESMLKSRAPPVSPMDVRNEHDPTAKQSNPSSSLDTRGKAAHKNVEKVELDPRAALIAMLSNRATLVGSTSVASIESIDQEDSYEPDPRTAVESMLKTQAPAVSPVGASKTDSSEQEVDLRNEHDPTAKQSNPSSSLDTRGKAAHKNVEKVEPDPRAALIAMLSNRATLVGSTSVASIESIDEEDSYKPDPRTAVESMLKSRAPPVSPVDVRNEHDPTAKQSNPSSSLDTRGKAAHKNVEKVEPDPRAALIAMPNNRATFVGSTTVASIESIDQEDSYEPDPRTAVESMLRSRAPPFFPVDVRNEHDPTAKKSNPSSSLDTRGKAAHKYVEKVEPDPRAALIAMLSNRATLVGSTSVASIESIDQEDSYEPDPRTAIESMLKTQAPAVSPVGASKTDSSEQEVDLRNEHDPTAKQSNLSSTRNTRGKAAHKNVEKVEPNPRVALIAMLNNRATLVGSTTVASIESIDQEDSYEPDPRTAVESMLKSRAPQFLQWGSKRFK